MAVNSKVWEENKDLMVTYTDDTTKILHKVGTEDYYDDPIDLIVCYYTDGDRAGQPKGYYEYEEVDRPVEEVIEEEQEEPLDEEQENNDEIE